MEIHNFLLVILIGDLGVGVHGQIQGWNLVRILTGIIAVLSVVYVDVA